MRSYRFVQLLLNSVLVLSLALPGLLSRAEVAKAQTTPSTNVVISEFRVRGPNGGNDEFVELYNLSTSPIDIGGWKIKGSNATGAISDRATIPGGTILNPGCHYLLTNSNTTAGPYSGSVPGDQTYTTGITDDGGIAVTLPDNSIVDQVGMSAGSAFKEGTPLANLGTTNLDRGYERKPGGEAGSGIDTDNNSNDFQLISPSDPQNLSSPCIEIVITTDPLINEFVFNHVGTDTHEYVEIFGGPNTDYSAFTILQIEGDGTGAGVIDSVHIVGTTDANGFWTTGFLTNIFENGTVTLLLVEEFTGAVGSDLDTNNDGVFDSTPWSRLVDDVAVSDGGAGDVTYSSTVLAPNFDGISFTPGGASRIPNGTDTDSVSNWTRNDFDLAGIPGFEGTPSFGEAYNTPGSMNEAVMPQLVINEIDYDQPGTDTAEFIEIRNNSGVTISLDAFTVELVNGNAGGAVIYQTIDLPDINLPAEGYFVICANSATVSNCNLDVAPDTNLIQNGAPDAVGLRFNGILIDAVSYEGDTGAPYTEGSGVGLEDNGANANEGISRCPDGADTNQNNVDFKLVPITPGKQNSCEFAPFVSSTTPADGASNVPLDANITITFSEPVNVTGDWFTIACSLSGAHTAVVSGGPTTFILDPHDDFSSNESCTVAVFASQVTDQDTDDPPDNMEADYSWSFSTVEANVCELPYTPIYDIQGSGPVAAITGAVTTQGVVVGDYEYPGSGPTSDFLRGFYLQDATGDGDPTTSDGIFVFNGNNNNVNLGEVVRVSGTAGEFQDQTQLSSVTSIVTCGEGSVAPVDVTFPVPSATYLERFEGMLVRLPQTLYVTEHFQLGRFGQVVLSSGGRLQQPTNVVEPGDPAKDLQAQNDLNRIILDDDLQNQNPDPILFGRGGQPLSASNTLRGGDTATGIVGVMTYTWSGNAASGNAYRVRPINALGGGVPNFQPANPRPESAPEVGGTLKVVGMNLLNYFNTFSGCTNGVGGTPTDCRGAENLTEFNRQWPKTVAAILAMDPDVLGVNEIENDGYGPNSAMADLVDRLNTATAPGTYAFIDADAATGQVNALGTDAIKVGLIYKPASVTPVGQTAALNTVAFVNGGDSAPRSRPALAQAFEQNSNGAVFIVSVNHFKSKGSPCDAPDAGDGQGNCNLVRLNAALELMNWLAGDPTGANDPDILLIGDYNSYAKEDPIAAIEDFGFTNLIEYFLGPEAYSYVFDGQWGYLDHALGSPTMLPQVSGVADYHINADEPSVLDYNTNFKSSGQIVSLYAADQFRVSDHDPVIVGLELDGAPIVEASPASQSLQYSDPITAVTITATDVLDDISLDAETAWSLDGGDFIAGLPNGLALSEPECGGKTCTWTLSGNALLAPGAYVVRVTAIDKDGESASIDVTITVTQEDARATYTGTLFAATSSASSSTAKVTLAATIQDISAVTGDPAYDAFAGDITNATVKFVDRDHGNAELCTASVGLVDPSDTTTGTATCTWQVDLGSADSISATIGVVVGGYYTRNSPSEDSVVTVSRALTSNFITGGGYLLLESSAGQLAGDAGSRNNFGFHVKYNKSGKNLQGRMNILVISDGRVYQIKGNVMTSLVVQPAPCPDATVESPCMAEFSGKASIQDVTDPDNPISIDGNAALHVTMTDSGEPGSSDSLGITVWNKNGGLWFASRWNGVMTLEQALHRGNLVVH